MPLHREAHRDAYMWRASLQSIGMYVSFDLSIQTCVSSPISKVSQLHYKESKKYTNTTHELCKCDKGIPPRTRRDTLVPLGYIR